MTLVKSALKKQNGASGASSVAAAQAALAAKEQNTGLKPTVSAGSSGVQYAWQTKEQNADGFRDMDYSLAIRNAASDAEIKALQAERQKKIDAIYGGVDPYNNKTTSGLTGAQTSGVSTASKYGQNWNPQTTNLAETQKYAAVQKKINDYRYKADQLAQQGKWDEAAVWINKIAEAEGSNADGEYNMKNANDYFRELMDQYGYNAREYYGVTNDSTTSGGSAAELPGVSGGGTGGAGMTGTSVSDTVKSNLEEWLKQAQEQQTGRIDDATQQAIAELQRNQQDAEVQYQQQRDQIAIEEAKAKDNQALYAQARGDRGGIGAAQYDAIMANAAQNRLAVNQAQTQMATDTARQITDLRAQGEFEKADALLALTQQYLSQLMELEQWSMEYGLSVEKFRTALQQWQAEYGMDVANLTGIYNGLPTLKAQQIADEQTKRQQSQLAEAAETLLKAGILPSASQLNALGITTQQAQSYIAAGKLAKQSKKTGGSNAASDSDEPAKTMKLSDAKAMAKIGIFTKPVVQAFLDAGYTKGYLEWQYGYQEPVDDINTTPIREFGTEYNSVWGRVREMFDAGKSVEEIAAYLERFDNHQLSSTGRNYILHSLSLV